MAFDVITAIKAIILASITFIVITSVDEFIDRIFIERLNLDKDKTSTWGALSLIYIFIALIILLVMNQSLNGIIGVDFDIE